VFFRISEIDNPILPPKILMVIISITARYAKRIDILRN